jgi:hypothetical protein
VGTDLTKDIIFQRAGEFFEVHRFLPQEMDENRQLLRRAVGE